MKPKPIRKFTRAAIALLMMMLTTATAWAETTEWTGSGTKDDPYMINDKDQLLLLAYRVNGTHNETCQTDGFSGKYFKLGADIAFDYDPSEGNNYAENYEAIGGRFNNNHRYFYGNFDGANKTVSGIRIRKTGTDDADCFQGLFGRTGNGANIHHVHLTDARIQGYARIGGIVGSNCCTVSNCTVTESAITAINGYGTIFGYNSGGILSHNYYRHCTVNGSAVISGKGCDGADITVNDGAVYAAFSETGINEYTIGNAGGWDVFCDALLDNDTYNRFSGKTVYLGTDITVTSMAGASKHDFCGTFDGQGNTLTVSYGSAESRITEQYAAPFRFVEGCTIQNLRVSGSIYTSAMNASGLIADQYGAVTISNCRSSVTINSSVSGDGTHGGFVAVNHNGSGTLTIEGCVFDGKLLTTNGTTRCGGFIGWRGCTTEIHNSLFAPTEVTVGTEGSATFARNKVDTYNCYYTYLLNDGTNYAPYLDDGTVSPAKWNNGKALRTIEPGANVTISNIALTGNETEYNVSGITAYSGGGLSRGGNLYYGRDDQLNLTLSTDAPLGYQYSSYTASAGILVGSDNPYSFTMPDEDVTISAVLRSDGQSHYITYMKADGTTDTQAAIALDETMTSLDANQWYFVGKDIDYTQTVTPGGNVTIILKDGCTMNVGTSSQRISSGSCIDSNNGFFSYSLTIYGQSDDPATAGTLNAYNSDSNEAVHVKNYTQHGGTVTIAPANATALYLGGGDLTLTRGTLTIKSDNYDAILTDNGHTVTVSGGTLSATAGRHAIRSALTMSGGNVTATGGKGAIFAATNVSGGTLTINGNIDGTVTIADGKAFTDGSGHYYTGTLTADEKAAINGKTLYPYGITVTANANGDDRWASFYDGTQSYRADATVYTAAVSGDNVVLTPVEGGIIPAGNAVLLKAAASPITLQLNDAAASTLSGNDLKGVDERTAVSSVMTGAMEGCTPFVLSKKGDNFGFYEYTADYLPAHKAFLAIDDATGAREFTLVFDDVTGIDATLVNSEKVNSVVYDLQGRRVSQPAKGLYIVNGRKVVVR